MTNPQLPARCDDGMVEDGACHHSDGYFHRADEPADADRPAASLCASDDGDDWAFWPLRALRAIAKHTSDVGDRRQAVNELARRVGSAEAERDEARAEVERLRAQNAAARGWTVRGD